VDLCLGLFLQVVVWEHLRLMGLWDRLVLVDVELRTARESLKVS